MTHAQSLVLALLLLVGGCASSWNDYQPPPIRPLHTEVLLEDRALADICDIKVEAWDDGSVRRVIVAGFGGAVILDGNLKVTATHYGSGKGGGMLIDLDGDEVPERLS